AGSTSRGATTRARTRYPCSAAGRGPRGGREDATGCAQEGQDGRRGERGDDQEHPQAERGREGSVTNGTTPTRGLASIRVTGRHRKGRGDLDARAARIQRIGLLHPIVIQPDGTLITGQRRLEAIRKLGWSQVPVRVLADSDDVVQLLLAERDENTCRKDFTPS